MSGNATSASTEVLPGERLEKLFDELAELTGQRNAIDGRIVEITAEIDHDELWGNTGARSIAALVAWKTGVSPANAETIAAVAHRANDFPRCTQQLKDGRLSLDQVGVIAQRAGDGSDAHYAELALSATVRQLRTAIKLEPRPEPESQPERPPSITRTVGAHCTDWRIRLPNTCSAQLDAALQSHHDALIAEWKTDREAAGARNDAGPEDPDSVPSDDDGSADDGTAHLRPPFPTNIDAFMRLVQTSWDTEAQRRPHGHRTTVVVHLDVKDKLAELHLGPLLPASERQYLTCDATAEVWFERDGEVLGAGRTTRTISRRLRRALEHRHPTCAIPGCPATRGLHAHHIRHWEDGGPTELDNLVLVCPYHHRQHHRGAITITGPALQLTVTDADGEPLHPGSLARPPQHAPPAVPPCPGPTGERADWWWYQPFEPQPPPEPPSPEIN